MKSAQRTHLYYTVGLGALFVAGVMGAVLWSQGGSTPVGEVAVTREQTPETPTPAPTPQPAEQPGATPAAPQQPSTERLGGETTAAVPPGGAPASGATPLTPDRQGSGELAYVPAPDKPAFPRFDAEDGPLDALRSGIDALTDGEIDAARAARDALPATSLDRHILAWAIALNGARDVPSNDIAAAIKALPDWPAERTLRRNLERALFREKAPADDVVRLIGGVDPLTAEGASALTRAQLARGEAEAAKKTISALWRRDRMDAARETAILDEFGPMLSEADHRERMERMLYAERISSAGRVATLAGAKPLFDAWSAVMRGDAKAARLLDAVPKEQRAAGYLFARTEYLRRKNRISEAAQLVLQAPKEQNAFLDADAWWNERRLLSRKLIDAGNAKLAYQVAAIHTAESPTQAADAEFHAGWYALRWLKDAKAAAPHFERIAKLSEGPISQSRAYYWLARAAEAGGPGDAKALYEKAAAFGTTFYGQLAAAKLDKAVLNVAHPQPSEADRANFAVHEAVRAARRLEAAGAYRLADTLTLDIAGDLTSPGELALLAATTESRGNHYLALKVAKAAALRGVDIGGLSHPVGVIPATADISGSGMALAYAIARQESEFNIGAVSSAGALGLLQLMPDTAKVVAKKVGLPYSLARLTTDPGYNATLGAAYLGQQLDRFDGSYVLTFIGYNAGPRRADQWIKRYGDPRGKSVEEIVDWIERIPFSETRSYVQRVMENYEVYKVRITGGYDIVGDLRNGRT